MPDCIFPRNSQEALFGYELIIIIFFMSLHAIDSVLCFYFTL